MDSSLTTPVLEMQAAVLAGFSDAAPFDFTLKAGERLLLLGETQSGKTTFLKTATGLISPLAGVVRLFGQDIRELSFPVLRRLRQRTGVVFARDGLLPTWTGYENLILPLQYRAGWRSTTSRDDVARHARAYAIPDEWLDHPAERLNRGQRAMLALLRALLPDPEVLLVDYAPLDLMLAYGEGGALRLLVDAVNRPSAAVFCIPDHGLAGLPEGWRRNFTRVAQLVEGRVIAESAKA